MFEHQAGAELLRNVDRQQLCKVRQAVLAYQGCDADMVFDTCQSKDLRSAIITISFFLC